MQEQESPESGPRETDFSTAQALKFNKGAKERFLRLFARHVKRFPDTNLEDFMYGQEVSPTSVDVEIHTPIGDFQVPREWVEPDPNPKRLLDGGPNPNFKEE